MVKKTDVVAPEVESEEATEEYQVLYRQYRPRQFSDVVGQDHVIVPLQRAIAAKKLAHAYLFTGPRGCGKTTSARLLAAAANCDDLSPQGEPCGKCATCDGVINGSGVIGVTEMDAASNRGIDAMKSILESPPL